VHVQDSNVAPPEAAYPPPPHTPPPGAPPPPAAGARPPVAGPVVSLYADTPKARLQTQGPLQWQDVCVTPCNVTVNPAAVYRVGGGTIRPSDSFNLPRSSGRVVIQARYGSNIKHWVGIALIGAGVLNALVGAFYINNAEDLNRNDGNDANGPDFYKGVGIGSIIHGVIVAGIGLSLSLSSTEVVVK
jgi:hypothetical protein